MKRIVWLIMIWLFLPSGWGAPSFQTAQWHTNNGALVIFYQSTQVPMLDINVAFAAGSAYDGKTFGLSALTSRLLNQGNQGLSSDVIAEKLEATGAQFDQASTRDMILLNLRTLTEPKALAAATETFASIIAHPDFPPAAFAREKSQQIIAIAQAQDTPEEVADLAFFKTLYKDHPYAHPILGTQETVTPLKEEDVRNFYKRYLVGRNALIVLVGAIDKSSAAQIAERIVQDLPTGEVAPAIPAAKASSNANQFISFPSSQTIVRLGQLGITHNDPDYFPLLVGNYILGGGSMVSNLSLELREKRGLTYGIYSQFLAMPGVGPFMISFSTKSDQAATAIGLTKDSLLAFLKSGPTDKQLSEAKEYLTGSFPLSLASNRNIAEMLMRRAFYHLPEDYLDTYVARINAVTRGQILTAFQTHIHPEQLLQVSVGQQ